MPAAYRLRRIGRRLGTRIIAAAWLGCFAGHAAAAEWNGYATLATDYIYRGISLLDTGASLQASVEGRFDPGFVVGAWGANIDRQWVYQQHIGNSVEVNFFAGMDFDCGSRCRARVIVTRYTYPDSDASSWQEISGSVSYAGRVGASLSWSPEGLGTIKSTRTLEGWFVQPVSRATSLELDGGRMWVGSRDYWFARAGISHRVDRWVVGLSHYWSDPTYRRFGIDDRSQRYVASLSTAF